MAASNLFYEKVLADPLLSPFFDELDMSAQVQKQLAFLARAFGGPKELRGRDLRTAHAPLLERGLADSHFDAVLLHLRATLEEIGVESGAMDEALAIVGRTRAQVLGR